MDNTNSIYYSMKGKICPINGIICQRGFCSDCGIPLSIPVVEYEGKAKDVFDKIEELARANPDTKISELGG